MSRFQRRMLKIDALMAQANFGDLRSPQRQALFLRQVAAVQRHERKPAEGR